MSASSLIAFATLAFVLIVVPGPSVLFVIGRAMSCGRRAALLTVAGNACGFYAQVVLVALGLGAIVEQSVIAYTTVKLVGSAYLIYLGVQAVLRRRLITAAVGTAPCDKPTRSMLVDGFVVGLTNPKTIVFFAAIAPQYVDRSGPPAGVQIMTLGLVFVSIALMCDSLWGVAAGSARRWLERNPRRLEQIGAAGGLAVIGLGVNLAVSGRKS